MKSTPSPANPDEPFEAELSGFPAVVEGHDTIVRENIEVVVGQFTDELRAGLNPQIVDYTRRHPHLADELEELLPLVLSLEHWSVDKEVECVRSTIPADFTLKDIGRYRVVREIGRGGMGIVFEAREHDTGRTFAIKLLPLRNVSDLERRRDLFRREAATIARLRHAHIVPVHSFGNYQGYTYYVMQLIDGVSLDLVLRKLRETQQPVCIAELLKPRSRTENASVALASFGADSWKAFAKIGVQVALGIGHAHSKGVLHNDIKPANLLIDAAGHITVTDFGVGHSTAETESDQESRAPGTLRYMAPERFAGQCDIRSDIYSLGVTLYEIITLTAAFEANDRQTLIRQVIGESPKAPRDINPKIPVPLERIVMKALSREPEKRFATADELRAELLRYINDRPILTRGSSLWKRLWSRSD